MSGRGETEAGKRDPTSFLLGYIVCSSLLLIQRIGFMEPVDAAQGNW